ncbi:hypothetical protein KI688_012576 [Linnemannia hyalina]|uniref:NAD(P)-binding protein n=1 Tax=Linnemannia hyalina TaxID=64524 RepID=A0A9P8BSX2_9FUNG|nr:hypothetical protein KI688_012576 [Linnemannia hyalina]
MVALAGRGAHAFLACRSQNRALAAIDSALLEVQSKYPLLITASILEFLDHFVFMMALLDRLKASQPSRIVMLSSMAHKSFAPRAGIDFETLKDPTKTTEVTRYGRSKLANVPFTKALARRLSSEQVYINACHPGVVATSLVRQEGTTFTEWVGAMEAKSAVLARNEELQEKLWTFSEELVREKVMA